jgi:hypothetical protein
MASFRIPLLFLLLVGSTTSAQDMRRCQGTDGSVVYTDRLCESEQSEKPAASTVTALAPQTLRSGRTGMPPPPACSKSPGELLYSIRAAIDMKDVNQLVKSYHWLGVSQEQSEALLTRLDTMVNRPLLDVQLLYPEMDSIPESMADEFASEDDYTYREAVQKPPYAMKVMQYRSNTSTETVSTAFRLQRHYQCWWIRF